MQNVHAGNAIEAPIMSLAAIGQTGMDINKTHRSRNKVLTDITP